MEWGNFRERGIEGLKKYRYVLLILLAGIFLMSLPEKKKETAPPEPASVIQPSLQEELSGLLSKIEGAGKVEILLTQAEGEQTLYQADEDRTSGENTTDIHRNTVLITNTGRGESGLIRQVNPPKYLGAVVLCQGAENWQVKLAIVEAVANATGLTTDKISVLKMK